MATGTLTPVAFSLAGSADLITGGATPTLTDGDAFTNTGYEVAWCFNGSGAPITVTIDAFPSGGQGAPSGLTVTDPTVTVAAAALKFFGPFPRNTFNNGSGQVKITCSAVVTVKVGVMSLSPAP